MRVAPEGPCHIQRWVWTDKQKVRGWGGGLNRGHCKKEEEKEIGVEGQKGNLFLVPFGKWKAWESIHIFFGPGFLLKEKSDHAQNCDYSPYERIFWPKAANSVFLSVHAPIVNVCPTSSFSSGGERSLRREKDAPLDRLVTHSCNFREEKKSHFRIRIIYNTCSL